MAFNNDEALKRAREDLGKRLGVSEDSIREVSVESAEFPDAALGAAISGEMSGQMITPGLRIRLQAKDGNVYEYRANKHQVRLFSFKGSNYRI